MSESAPIWVISDGRAGHDAQSIGLAEAIARRTGAAHQIRSIALAPWAAILPGEITRWFPVGSYGWPWGALAQGADLRDEVMPTMLIGAGRRTAMVTAALRVAFGVRTVQLLSPKLPATRFDAVIVPEHDGLTGPNVIRTVGAIGRVTAESISAATLDWLDHIPLDGAPRLAVLIGGPSASAKFTEADQRGLVAALEELSLSHTLLITLSRRTPAGFGDVLRARLPHPDLIWTPEGENPYPAILGLSDAVLVTEDSVNMASEAATAGLPVHIFPLGKVAAKIRSFHQSLLERGASRPFPGKIEAWSYRPLAEADRVTGLLKERGLLRGL